VFTLLKIRKALWGLMMMFGPWGIFLAGIVDSAGVPLPCAVDALLVTYVFKSPGRAWLFVTLAVAGSLIGCLILYFIGYAGGEILLERRMSAAKFQKISRDFDRNAFLTVAVPSLLPPPFPFKIFVLAAGAFEVRWTHFLLAVLVGRAVRYTLVAVATITLGPNVLVLLAGLIRQHPATCIAVLVALIALGFLLHRLRQSASRNHVPAAVGLESAEQERGD
jgi:membrane protein YqaA with SNARE-associated domain